jgi:hypothetical protein
MKVIFLDIDGVLNHEMWYRRRFEEMDMEKYTSKYPYYEFDPQSIEELNRIINETDAKVVISSTWRIGRTVDQLQELLNNVGFEGEIIGVTPHFIAKGEDINDNPISYTVPRGCEIEWWLEREGKFQRINWSPEKQKEYLEKSLVKNYVILDDDSDMLYNQREHFVKTSTYSGLTKEVANKVIKILNTSIIQLYYESNISR